MANFFVSNAAATKRKRSSCSGVSFHNIKPSCARGEDARACPKPTWLGVVSVKQITLHACGGAHDGEPNICGKRHFEACCPAASAVIFQHSPARTIRAPALSRASVRSSEALAE